MSGHLPLDKLQKLFFAVVFFHNLIIDVRAVEAGDEFGRVFQFEVVFDVGAGFRVGGGGQGDAGDLRVAVGQQSELAVFGTEVVPPLADAVRFVDGEQADGGVVEEAQETFAYQPFGRNVEQFQTACGDVVGDLAHVVGRRAAVYRRAMHACRAQVGHLVVHQRDQRRHHHRHAAAHQGGNLVTQRFAPARRHQHQQAVAARQRFDDFRLPPAKRGVAEHIVQYFKRGRGSHGGVSVIRYNGRVIVKAV